MTIAASLIGLARISDDLIAGLVIGAALGFLAGPLVRYILAVREWTAASREARVTDELLERLPAAAPDVPGLHEDEGVGAPTGDDDAERAPVPWPASR